jgi:hypothetical protein
MQQARLGGTLAVLGGVLAGVGNLLHPRFTGTDIDNYRKVAESDLYTPANLVIVAAIILTAAGFVAIAQTMTGTLAQYGGMAAGVGAAIALAQTGLETFGLKQASLAMTTAGSADREGAFWAANAIDRVNVGLFNTWTIVFLGLAPLLIGWAMLASRRAGSVVGWLGVIGGAGCVLVGFIGLAITDQDSLTGPFFGTSLVATLFILAAGVQLMRTAPEA